MEKRPLTEFIEERFPKVNPGVKARLACFYENAAYAYREVSENAGEVLTALLQELINQPNLDTGQVIAAIDTADLLIRQIQRARFLGSQERNPWFQPPRQ